MLDIDQEKQGQHEEADHRARLLGALQRFCDQRERWALGVLLYTALVAIFYTFPAAKSEYNYLLDKKYADANAHEQSVLRADLSQYRTLQRELPDLIVEIDGLIAYSSHASPTKQDLPEFSAGWDKARARYQRLITSVSGDGPFAKAFSSAFNEASVNLYQTSDFPSYSNALADSQAMWGNATIEKGGKSGPASTWWIQIGSQASRLKLVRNFLSGWAEGAGDFDRRVKPVLDRDVIQNRELSIKISNLRERITTFEKDLTEIKTPFGSINFPGSESTFIIPAIIIIICIAINEISIKIECLKSAVHRSMLSSNCSRREFINIIEFYNLSGFFGRGPFNYFNIYIFTVILFSVVTTTLLMIGLFGPGGDLEDHPFAISTVALAIAAFLGFGLFRFLELLRNCADLANLPETDP